MAADISEEFDIKVVVHWGSVLNILLSITVMEEAVKECEKGTPKNYYMQMTGS